MDNIETRQATLERLAKKKAMGKPLNFAERNILNIFERQIRPRNVTAIIVMKPTNTQNRGLIKHKKSGQYKLWRGETIKVMDFQFFHTYLEIPGENPKPIPHELMLQIFSGKLKDGSRVKTKI